LENQLIFEIIGYIASALVAISLMMSSILKLRILNMIGAIAFVIYGLLINAYPVALMNLFIVGINIYHLSHIFRSDTTRTFTLLEIEDESPYLKYVVDLYREDIGAHFSNFNIEPSKSQLAFMVMIGLNPVGVFIGEKVGEKTLDIRLDYVIPEYRDFKVGAFIYRDHKNYFTEKGIDLLQFKNAGEGQRFYLNKMGFSENRESSTFTLKLAS